MKLRETKSLQGSFIYLPEVICKLKSELSDRLHEEGNIIHYISCSVFKTKNNPFARGDIIIPGYETAEKFVPVALLKKTRYRTGNAKLNNVFPACRAMHCIALFIAPPLFMQGTNIALSRIQSWQFFANSMLVVSGKGQKEGEDCDEWEGC